MAGVKEGRMEWSKQKWLKDLPNFVEIKNNFGFFQTNLKADDWRVPLISFWKKCFSETPYYKYTPLIRLICFIFEKP